MLPLSLLSHLALLSSPAFAGSLTVDADRPVFVTVNNVPVAYDLRTRRAVVNDLEDGLYAVRVMSAEGARLGEAMMAVSGDLPATLSVRGSTLDRLVSARATAGEGGLWLGVPEGWGVEAQVEIDGQRATDLRAGPRWLGAGAHTLTVRVGGVTRFSGSVDVLPGQTTRCVVGNTLHCELGAMARSSKPEGGTQASTPASTPASTAPVTVTFVLKDSFDLSNVYVDGKRVAEFRTNDKEKSVQLTPGVHTVEIRSFTEFDTWARGALMVTPGEPIRVGYDQESVEVYNRTNAWTPKPQ